MSSFISRPSTFRSVAIHLRRTSTRRCMSTMHDNDPDVLDTEKRRNLSNTQHKTSTPHSSHAPGWNEHLASASEASVKADRSRDSSTADLQEETVEYVRARYTPDDRMAPTTAYYPKDEVAGPLGTAPGREDADTPQKVIKKVRVREETTESTTKKV